MSNDEQTISDRNDHYRSERLCKQLTARYGLYFASGKKQVKEYRLREPDKTKYEIYHALCDTVPHCHNWKELMAALRCEVIATEFRTRGDTSDVQGVVFAKNGCHSTVRRSTSSSQLFENQRCTLLLLTANYAVLFFLEIRLRNVHAAILMNLSTYFLCYWIFSSALTSLLDRFYITRRLRFHPSA